MLLQPLPQRLLPEGAVLVGRLTVDTVAHSVESATEGPFGDGRARGVFNDQLLLNFKSVERIAGEVAKPTTRLQVGHGKAIK